MKVLLVEDQRVTRYLTEELLAASGVDYESVADLADLRNRLLTGPQPDAVALDLVLPDGNALDLVPEIRQAWPDARLCCVTASLPQAELAREQGLPVLEKPYEVPELIKILQGGEKP